MNGIDLNYPAAVSKPLPVGAVILSPARLEFNFAEGSLGYLQPGAIGYDPATPTPYVARWIGTFLEKYEVTDPATNAKTIVIFDKTSPFDVKLTRADLDAIMAGQAMPGSASSLARAQEQGVLVAGSMPTGA